MPLYASCCTVLLNFSRYCTVRLKMFSLLSVCFFMYCLCEKYYKPISVQCYRVDRVSWVPGLTLLDLETNWTFSRNRTHSFVGNLLWSPHPFTSSDIALDFSNHTETLDHSKYIFWAFLCLPGRTIVLWKGICSSAVVEVRNDEKEKESLWWGRKLSWSRSREQGNELGRCEGGKRRTHWRKGPVGERRGRKTKAENAEKGGKAERSLKWQWWDGSVICVWMEGVPFPTGAEPFLWLTKGTFSTLFWGSVPRKLLRTLLSWVLGSGHLPHRDVLNQSIQLKDCASSTGTLLGWEGTSPAAKEGVSRGPRPQTCPLTPDLLFWEKEEPPIANGQQRYLIFAVLWSNIHNNIKRI